MCLVADAVITADRNKDDDHDDQDHDVASEGALCRTSAAVACSRLVLGLREGLLEARRVRSARMRSSSSDAGSSFGSWRANLPEKAFFKAGRSTSILLRSDAHCPCVCSGIVSPCASSRGAGLNCHEEFDLAIESMQEAVTLAGKRTGRSAAWRNLRGRWSRVKSRGIGQPSWMVQAGRGCLSPYLTSKICACLGDNQRAFARLDQA